jgi:DNA repair photolyase
MLTQPKNVKTREIQCKSAIGKCGFPGGGWAINPYVGCSHGCHYCYARFIKRFTGHSEKWGDFVDARINIAKVLQKQIKSPKYKKGTIFIGTVTDPYQPLEKEYRLTRSVLKVLMHVKNEVNILTKSDLVLRDLNLLKRFDDIEVSFTVNTVDEKWKDCVEPHSVSVKRRLRAMKNLSEAGVSVSAMMGPYWPFFTDAEALFKQFKKAGVKQVFTESLNTVGSNFAEVEKVLKNHYPDLLPKMKQILFDKNKFYGFYSDAHTKIKHLSKKYRMSINVFFGLGHAEKFE